MILDALPSFVSGLGAVALGGFVWSRAPRRVANSAFAVGMAGLAAMEFAHMMLLAGGPAHLAGFTHAALGAEVLTLPAWALFSVAFARADAGAELRRWRWTLVGLALSALAALEVSAVHPLTPGPNVLEREFILLTGYGKGLTVFALLATVFVLFQLESTLRHARGIARWQIKYFVLGAFGIFGFRIFVLSDMIMAKALRLAYLPVQSTAFLLGFALIGFCLVRHRLLEVEVFVSRHVVYQSLTVGAVGTYLLALGIAGWVMQRLQIELNLLLISLVIFVTAMALLIGLLSEAVRQRVKRAVARHFYRHKYDYRREWTELTRKLTSVVSPEAIPSRVMAMLIEAMGIRKAAFFLSREDGGYQVAESVGRLPADRLSIDRDSPLAARVGAEKKPLVLSAVEPDGSLGAAVAPLRAEGLTLVVPVLANEEVLGLLAVAPPSGSLITHEDEELLATVAAQAATALLNARLAERLAQARELEALNRVSSFILHDLKNCVSMLSLVSQNAETVGADPAFQRDALRTVAESVRKMQRLIDRLSRVPEGLFESRFVTTDLNSLAREAVNRARLAVNGKVRVSTEFDRLPTITADEEQVGKVLDNLIINAVEALTDTGEVTVRTMARNRSVCLEVSDTGTGIPERILRNRLFIPFQTTKPHGLGIGLCQVKSIVEGHGGRIHVVSREGKGTSVHVELPVAAGPAGTSITAKR